MAFSMTQTPTSETQAYQTEKSISRTLVFQTYPTELPVRRPDGHMKPVRHAGLIEHTFTSGPKSLTHTRNHGILIPTLRRGCSALTP